MRVLPSRVHVYSPDDDTAFIEGGDWTDALVSVRCKRFNPPLSNAVDLEFARIWIYDLEKTPDIFCLHCVNFVHKPNSPGFLPGTRRRTRSRLQNDGLGTPAATTGRQGGPPRSEAKESAAGNSQPQRRLHIPRV